MWKPRLLPWINAVIYDPGTHGRRLATEMLYRMHVGRISHAYSIRELVAMLNKSPFRLVIADAGGDSRTQAEFVPTLRDWMLRKPHNQVMVLTTADPHESRIAQLLTLNANAMLLKPYSPRGFCDRLAHAALALKREPD
jgi:DNA-binding NarL/FixJ family response regulator